MTATLLDFSRRPDLGLCAEIIGDFAGWTQEDAFDYELAGARMLGLDIRALLDQQGVERVVGLLSVQADVRKLARLPAEMLSGDPDGARTLLTAMLCGITAMLCGMMDRKLAPVNTTPPCPVALELLQRPRALTEPRPIVGTRARAN